MPRTLPDREEPLSGLSLPSTGLPVMRLGREICADMAALEGREWLVTNGIGGYAGGSLSGMNTRGYHGLLVAALTPPVGRTLMLAGLIETVVASGGEVSLSTIRWHDGTIAPTGWTTLEAVEFEGTLPTWWFRGPGFTVAKTVFMDHGANVTRVEYRVIEADEPLTLRLGVLTDFRDYHSRSFAGGAVPEVRADGDSLVVVGPGGPGTDLHLVCGGSDAAVRAEPYRGFDLAKERERGLTDTEDHLLAGVVTRILAPGETVQLVASAGRRVAPDPMARAAALARESELISRFRAVGMSPALSAAGKGTPSAGASVRSGTAVPLSPPAWVARLALAADQFIVRRDLSDGSHGHSVIAGYHWFADWGRDTMISLPGLTHMCGRAEIAASVLRAFADVVDGGMIPNRFPDGGERPEYNTVDATLWFAEAVKAHWRTTGDRDFLALMYPVLAGIVAVLQTGTRYGIRVDADGLIRAGEPGVQLTWMDAKVGDWVVTPRIGKPIEVNALWLSTLAFLAEIAPLHGAEASAFAELHARARAACERYWNPATGYAFDVIDGPDGNDPTLRPNQILAARASAGFFDAGRRRAIVEACSRTLLTPVGLRSLAPDDPSYRPRYSGDQTARDGAYHQGTVWAWLIGPFVEAHLDAYGDPAAAAAVLAPLADQLAIEAIGTVGEIFEAEPPHAPCGCVAQAWSVAETLRAWRLIEARRADLGKH
jgi:glycogen debranching enzyme